jgi:hypothetical protein
MLTKFWSQNLKRRGQSEDLGADGKITLEWILRKQSGKMWTEYIDKLRGILD